MTVTFSYTIIYVDDVPDTVQFFVDAFGLERRFVTPEGDYGELDTGSTTLAFASTELARSNLDAAGGHRYVDPIDKPWGQTVAYVLDPNGLLVEIATPMQP